MAPDNRSAAEAGKQFLIQRVLEQAQEDGVSLSGPERYMLDFSEVNGPPQDPEKVAQFDEQCDSDEYEEKVAGLIRAAYQSDKRRGQEASWAQALKALCGEDHYILVMVRQAGLKVPYSLTGAGPDKSGELDALVRTGIAMLAPGLLFLAGLLVLIDPWGWRLLGSDTRKLVFLVALLAAVYLLWSTLLRKLSTPPRSNQSDGRPGTG
ncbi:MAG TPA: hypothetical protein VEG08_03710 [Terriglobales bacterium]|nr:hypothetical protein [Terriglobales bacterium]